MKKKLFLLWLFLTYSFISCAQEIKIEGILNCGFVHSSFDKGQEEIKTSIKDDLHNLNLYEYSHTLRELYELTHSGEITLEEWDKYIDALLSEVKQERNDTIEPFFAIEYKGIIPFQAEYFIASLDKNKELKEKYSKEYRGLKESTSKLRGKGYTWNEIDTLLVVFSRKSTVGTVNFWYFLQVLGCPIIEIAIEKEGIEDIKMIFNDLRLSATFKTPLFLQIRKFQNLKKMVSQCSFKDINDIEMKAMFADMSVLGKDYYDIDEGEGINRNKLKIF
jgi:hypothetical protein